MKCNCTFERSWSVAYPSCLISCCLATAVSSWRSYVCGGGRAARCNRAALVRHQKHRSSSRRSHGSSSPTVSALACDGVDSSSSPHLQFTRSVKALVSLCSCRASFQLGGHICFQRNLQNSRASLCKRHHGRRTKKCH